MGRGAGGTWRLNPEAWAPLGRARPSRDARPKRGGLGRPGLICAGWPGQGSPARPPAGPLTPEPRPGPLGRGDRAAASHHDEQVPPPVGAGQALPQRARLAVPGAPCRTRSTVTVPGSPGAALGAARRGQLLGRSAEERLEWVGPGWRVLCRCGCWGRGVVVWFSVLSQRGGV